MSFIGAPNTSSNSDAKTVKKAEVVDKYFHTFHHADLASADGELQATTGVSRISPYLYIGSWDNSVDLDYLRKENFKYILNVTELKKNKDTVDCMNKVGIIHEHLSIENIPDAQLSTILQSSYAFIKRAIDSKQSILVHCHQGLSTSVAVIAYYMLKLFYSQRKPAQNLLNTIITRIQQARGYIDINFGFIEQLEDIESELSGRPIILNESLSIRRNAQLKANLNRQMLQNIETDKAFADREYKLTSKKRY